MAGPYSKNLWGCFLVLILAASVQRQAATSGTASQAPAAPQTAAPAQEKEQKPAPVYESATVLKSITRLVVVDVVATDKNGAVTDLVRDDFTVLEDGKEQKVRVFNFQKPTINANGGAAVVPPKLPENVFSNVARYSASS